MDGYQISFQFQMGLVRDRVTMDSASLNLKSLKSKACDFICEKFPQNGLNRLDERILLFKHDYKSTNILQVSSKFLCILNFLFNFIIGWFYPTRCRIRQRHRTAKKKGYLPLNQSSIYSE